MNLCGIDVVVNHDMEEVYVGEAVYDMYSEEVYSMIKLMITVELESRGWREVDTRYTPHGKLDFGDVVMEKDNNWVGFSELDMSCDIFEMFDSNGNYHSDQSTFKKIKDI